MSSKLFGGILLVIGTTIGAGMLALPVATAELGFMGSMVLLITGWAIMTACAFLFLEVNLWLPPNSNLISMAGVTLGKPGQAVTWVVYLTLLYSILAAYVSGGGDLFHYQLANLGVHVPLSIAAVLFTVLFGSVVCYGIKAVDYANRGLMFGKMLSLVLLIALILPFVAPQLLWTGSIKHIAAPTSITVTVVSFACMMIIPSLRTYFNDDVKSLRKAIFFGMLIPLICYIAWDMVILGVIPFLGHPGLKEMLHSASSNSDIIAALNVLLQQNSVNFIVKFFTSICMATSFLSVSLSLSDFLADGFGVQKKGFGLVLVTAVTFLPPVIMEVFYPDAFIRCLQYAGISCFILFLMLPALMAWRGRYHLKAQPHREGYQFLGGKFLLAILVIFATLMIGFGMEGAI